MFFIKSLSINGFEITNPLILETYITNYISATYDNYSNSLIDTNVIGQSISARIPLTG